MDLQKILKRFHSKIEKCPDTGCWVWTGTLRNGYGCFSVMGGYQAAAHRWYFEHLNGPVSKLLFLDHLCRRKSCVNPDHLEPVRPRENTLRDREYRYDYRSNEP